jgi:hypothetical protein
MNRNNLQENGRKIATICKKMAEKLKNQFDFMYRHLMHISDAIKFKESNTRNSVREVESHDTQAIISINIQAITFTFGRKKFLGLALPTLSSSSYA